MRHLYYQKFDKNRISPLQRKVLTLKVFTFASEFLKIRIMEIKEYFEKEMFFENLPSIVFTTPSVPPVLGDRNPQGREDVTALQCCICPTCPSPAGGSLTHSQALALSKRARDVTAPPVALNRCALRLAGHQSPRQVSYAGWDRRGEYL